MEQTKKTGANKEANFLPCPYCKKHDNNGKRGLSMHISKAHPEEKGKATQDEADTNAAESKTEAKQKPKSSTQAQQKPDTNDKEQSKVCAAASTAKPGSSASPVQSTRKPGANKEANFLTCPHCGKDNNNGKRGLSMHISKAHPEEKGKATQAKADLSATESITEARQKPKSSTQAQQKQDTNDKQQRKVCTAAPTAKSDSSVRPVQSTRKPGANKEANFLTCPHCGKDDNNGKRGLSMHISKAHPEERGKATHAKADLSATESITEAKQKPKSSTQAQQKPDTNDKEQSKVCAAAPTAKPGSSASPVQSNRKPGANKEANFLTCPHCGKDDNNGKRGLSMHISKAHPEEKVKATQAKADLSATESITEAKQKPKSSTQAQQKPDTNDKEQSKVCAAASTAKPGSSASPVQSTRKYCANKEANFLTCPYCGKADNNGKKGLSIHISKAHPEEKGKATQDEADTSATESTTEVKQKTESSRQAQRKPDTNDKEQRKVCTAAPRAKPGSSAPPVQSNRSIKREDLKDNCYCRQEELKAKVTDSGWGTSCPLCAAFSSDDDLDIKKHLKNKHIETRELKMHDKEVTLKMEEVSEQVKKLNKIVEDIGKSVGTAWKPRPAGSYYDKTKVRNPDEFDYMFCQKSTKCVVHPYVDPNYPEQVTHFVKLEVMEPRAAAVKDLLTIDSEGKRWLCPKAFRADFAKGIERAICPYRTETEGPRHSLRGVRAILDPKLSSPSFEISVPAVNYRNGVKYRPSVDLVASVEKKGWPKFAEKSHCDWVSAEEWDDCKEHFHAVPKIHFTEYEKPANKCLLWRLSFSMAEKKLLLHADGKKGTCRKMVHKMLKNDVEKLKTELKENKQELKTFCSYHIKNIMFGMFNRYPSDEQWKKKLFSLRYLQAVALMKMHVKSGYVDHFFLPGDNLLEDMVTTEDGAKQQMILANYLDGILKKYT